MLSSLFGFREFFRDTKPDIKVLFHPYFPEPDFWTGIASECGIAAVDDKPGCGCVVILRTKLPELSRLAKIVADPNHRKE
jgi:hypothetical protein